MYWALKPFPHCSDCNSSLFQHTLCENLWGAASPSIRSLLLWWQRYQATCAYSDAVHNTVWIWLTQGLAWSTLLDQLPSDPVLPPRWCTGFSVYLCVWIVKASGFWRCTWWARVISDFSVVLSQTGPARLMSWSGKTKSPERRLFLVALLLMEEPLHPSREIKESSWPQVLSCGHHLSTSWLDYLWKKDGRWKSAEHSASFTATSFQPPADGPNVRCSVWAEEVSAYLHCFVVLWEKESVLDSSPGEEPPLFSLFVFWGLLLFLGIAGLSYAETFHSNRLGRSERNSIGGSAQILTNTSSIFIFIL